MRHHLLFLLLMTLELESPWRREPRRMSSERCRTYSLIQRNTRRNISTFGCCPRIHHLFRLTRYLFRLTRYQHNSPMKCWMLLCLLIVHRVRFAVFFHFCEFIFVAFYSLKFVRRNHRCIYAASWDGYMRYVNEASSSISSSFSADASLTIDKRWTRFLFEWWSHKCVALILKMQS